MSDRMIRLGTSWHATVFPDYASRYYGTPRGLAEQQVYWSWKAFLDGRRVLLAGSRESVFLDRHDARGIWIAS